MSRQGATLLALASFAGCGAVDDGSDTTTATAESSSALIIPPVGQPVILPPIAVRIISIDDDCNGLSDAIAAKYIRRLNEAGSTMPGWSLSFSLYRIEEFSLPKPARYDIVDWDDLKPLWQGLGMSSSQGDELVELMHRKYPGPPETSEDKQPYLFRWLARFQKMLMPDQIVAFQGCEGGVDSGLVISPSNVVHEFGHYFGLGHSFRIAIDPSVSTPVELCPNWDLLYAARGKGKANRYFTSVGDCQSYLTANPSVTPMRVDPRTGDAIHPAGLRDDWKGDVVIQHPRCPTCDVSLDDPADNSVERYTIGDAQVAGYARLLNGVTSVNAMAYTSTGRGFPDTTQEWTTFFSPAQVSIMRSWANANPWVFKQGKPVPIVPPADSCARFRAGEGFRRDGSFLSCDGRFRLYLQADGNLVLSQKVNGQFQSAIWSTGSLTWPHDTTDITLIMQDDGNLVVYDANQVALWSTRTSGNPGAYVRIDDTGDFQVRTAHSVLWHTDTGGR